MRVMAPPNRERPILFSGPMVRAILAGQKTQTRRVITKGTSTSNARWEHLHWELPVFVDNGFADGHLKVPYWVPGDEWDEKRDRVRCRWQVGDRLWVRETWADVNSEDGPAVLYRADEAMRDWRQWCKEPGPDEGNGPSMNYDKYKGDWTCWWSDLLSRDEHGEEGYNWRPSIFMPRWASRIVLPVVSVRAERLQDITTADIIAEGIDVPPVDYSVPERPDFLEAERDYFARSQFRKLWDGINAPRGFGWDSNPWVWVTEFPTFTPGQPGDQT